MKKRKNMFLFLSKFVVALALMVTTLNVNSTCMFYINQPPLPKAAKRLRRF